MTRTYSQIDMEERRKIALWHTAGISVEMIAEKLHRHLSTIFRELRRNTFEDREMLPFGFRFDSWSSQSFRRIEV
ncbi:helix-turn-helix domain-containing protein, partial [Rhizobium johnstonii]|uniref:helix-turn-helix domain-containing protein n=1 Tax=Rhizobium johnstonii TaxID=3019933 RepID=UPI003F9A3EE6